MRGTILTFEQNRGIISGQDGNRYEFVRLDWAGNSEPYAGLQVDFIEHGNEANSVFPLQTSSAKSKLVLALVCWFLGTLGIHRFMVGKVGTGILMLVLTCTLFGLAITWPWNLIDFILILTGNFKDKDGNKIQQDGI